MSDVFQHIEELYNDEDQLKSLVVFADYYISTHSLFIPNDFNAEDIVITVIEKNLDGQRGHGFYCQLFTSLYFILV